MTAQGYGEDAWEAALEEARSVLVGKAEAGRDISYSGLCSLIGSIRFQPQEGRFHNLLGDLSTREDEGGRGMLSVLVVQAGGEKKPGKGFFDLARHLGRTGDDYEIWIAEHRAVTDYWQGKS